MKKLMVLGATYTLLPLIRAAKELGYKTIVTSTPGDFPCFKEADEVCLADITNPEEVYEKAKKYSINGIATCCMDTGVRSIGYVSERLNLCGLTEKAALSSNNKYVMKKAFLEYGVNSAKFNRVSNMTELEKTLTELRLPLIVKAVDLQGSRGIYIARTKEEVIKGFSDAMQKTKESFCIVEEFIEGFEFGAQAFVYNGEVLFVLPHGDNTYMYHTAIPIGHYAPLNVNNTILEQTKMQVELAIKAIGLNNCAVNVDLIMKDDMIYVIELTGRAGATCLPELVSIYYDINYYNMIVLMAMGEDPRTEFDRRSKSFTANASRFLLSDKDGIIREIVNKNKNKDFIFNLTVDVKPGDSIRRFTDGRDRLGQVIVKGGSTEFCLDKISEVISNISFVME